MSSVFSLLSPPLRRFQQKHPKKTSGQSLRLRDLGMKVLGLRVQILERVWLASGVLDHNSSQRLKCTGCARNLMWGEQIFSMRPAKECLCQVYSQAWNIRLSFFFLSFSRIFYFIFLIHLYWSIIASQCCVSFCSTKWISHMHTYVPISPASWASLPSSLSHPSRWSQSSELISLCYAAASH